MALIEKGADVNAKEKVKCRYSVSRGEGANDQRMIGTKSPDLGACITGRKYPMQFYCGLCHVDLLTCVLSCTQHVLHIRAGTADSWCCST